MPRSFYEALTTPPPRQPPPPKYPLFTKDPFSTTSFGPGHLVGLGAFAIGGVFIWKWAKRKKAEADQARQHLATGPTVAPGSPTSPVGPVSPAIVPKEPKVAQVENQRGQYGSPGGKR